MEIRKIHISKMNPATYNPREVLQPDDARYQSLQRSLAEFGYIDPIVWNERTGNIVGGHRRYDVLVAAGEMELDVSVVDLDEQREKGLNLALNKISGAWDQEMLSSLLYELKDTEVMEYTGFTTFEVENLLDSTAIDIDSMFMETPSKPPGTSTEPKEVECPHCGEVFEVELE